MAKNFEEEFEEDFEDSSEDIDEDEFTELVERIIKLPEKKIDKLWSACGVVIPGHGKNKAISDERIEMIKSSPELASDFIETLLSECSKREVLKNLDKIEWSKK